MFQRVNNATAVNFNQSVGKSGHVEHGNQYDLILMYEHYLERSAYSIFCGMFGQVTGRDFICVQALDGTLAFYEQENFAFSRFLPSSLFAGPIAYVPKTDSIVTVSCAWQIESYK